MGALAIVEFAVWRIRLKRAAQLKAERLGLEPFKTLGSAGMSGTVDGYAVTFLTSGTNIAGKAPCLTVELNLDPKPRLGVGPRHLKRKMIKAAGTKELIQVGNKTIGFCSETWTPFLHDKENQRVLKKFADTRHGAVIGDMIVSAYLTDISDVSGLIEIN